MWFKVDDRFWSHPKVTGCSDSAIALWVRAGSYCAMYLTDGFIADSARNIFGIHFDSDAEKLVECGLWEKVDGGFQFHDWSTFQPASEAVKAKRAADRQRKSKDGKIAAESRWNPRGSRNGIHVSSNAPVPVPNSSSKEEQRDDVNAVITAFQESLEARGIKTKKPPQSWLKDARLMIDVDKHSVEQIKTCITWTTNNAFWRGNILTIPKLREKYEQLRLAAEAERSSRQRNVTPARNGEALWDSLPQVKPGVRLDD